MSLAATCPYTRIWLHRTVRLLLKTHSRCVSTTSAINRGLRSETTRDDRNRGYGADRSSARRSMRSSRYADGSIRSAQRPNGVNVYQRPSRTDERRPQRHDGGQTNLNQLGRRLNDIIIVIQAQEALVVDHRPQALIDEAKALVARYHDLASSSAQGAIVAHGILSKFMINATFCQGNIGQKLDDEKTVVYMGRDNSVRLAEMGDKEHVEYRQKRRERVVLRAEKRELEHHKIAENDAKRPQHSKAATKAVVPDADFVLSAGSYALDGPNALRTPLSLIYKILTGPPLGSDPFPAKFTPAQAFRLIHSNVDRINEATLAQPSTYNKTELSAMLNHHLGKQGKLWVNGNGKAAKEQPASCVLLRFWWSRGGRIEVDVVKNKLIGAGIEETELRKFVDARASMKGGSGERKPTEIASKDDSQLTTARTMDGDHAMVSSGASSNKNEDHSATPLSIRYTTAASTFLYGTNSVLAALKGKTRRLYQLYLRPKESTHTETIEQLARDASVQIHRDPDLKLLDKMAGSRPHNGVVLEASRLPTPPVLALGRPDQRTAIVPLTLDRQSAEDVAVNGAPEALPFLTNTWRYPFIVMLDGITATGNLGNILRTCHFYGVDAVAVATNTCANLSNANLAKASSGACEAVRLLALPKPSNFVFDSAKRGWRIYAAVAPSTSPTKTKITTSSEVSKSSPLAKHPCILMLGAEGEGLRDNLTRRADYRVSISGGERGLDYQDVGVDSLNVGLAAGVLVDAFLRKPEEEKTLGF